MTLNKSAFLPLCFSLLVTLSFQVSISPMKRAASTSQAHAKFDFSSLMIPQEIETTTVGEFTTCFINEVKYIFDLNLVKKFTNLFVFADSITIEGTNDTVKCGIRSAFVYAKEKTKLEMKETSEENIIKEEVLANVQDALENYLVENKFELKYSGPGKFSVVPILPATMPQTEKDEYTLKFEDAKSSYIKYLNNSHIKINESVWSQDGFKKNKELVEKDIVSSNDTSITYLKSFSIYAFQVLYNCAMTAKVLLPAKLLELIKNEAINRGLKFIGKIVYNFYRVFKLIKNLWKLDRTKLDSCYFGKVTAILSDIAWILLI